jgi:hypothetical protein
MKWTETELNEVINLIKSGKTYGEISNIVGRSKSSIKNKLGRSNENYKKYVKCDVLLCIQCDNVIKNFGIKFCSRSCATTYNNLLRGKNPRKCKCCGGEYFGRAKKYCSIYCFHKSQWMAIVNLIESGDTSLSNRRYKKYLIYKYGEQCMECGWDKINPYSGNIPIELEHIDGNSNNNSLDNLKLLCPNCHSLTPTYKALNIGNGRHNRMVRYKSGKSF